ncbi:MAG: NAD(P)/FAD-dependent oxidoreductase [Alphaproteobacteria bacterium]|nr:NAD(P)/FAD-dependent oxidoreductase [Alphaproteobacteria bacterium]
MTKQILIAGSGFAGTWAALAAARAVSLAGKEGEIAVTVVSPEPALHMRPRLYETAFDEMTPGIGPLLEAVGVRHLPGTVSDVDTAGRRVTVAGKDGTERVLSYDRFVLATGSTLFRPAIPGLAEHAFDVDQFDGATRLHDHLTALAGRPDTPARNTVVVVGGGFTGIELATKLPARLRSILGPDAAVRVVVLERAPAVGWELGDGPRPVIEEALADAGVESRTGAAAGAIDAGGVVTTSGERIEAATVVWTAGMRASPLAARIPGAHDALGRLAADRYLRAQGVPGVFVAGDVALAATDDDGNTALMSCQHALKLGRVAGHNAAAELAGLPLHPYSQALYVTCLDLGPWGAVQTEGWDRRVVLTRGEAKALKREINTKWIYPPAPDRQAAFTLADPAYEIVG